MVIHVKTLDRQIVASNAYRFTYLLSVICLVTVLRAPAEAKVFHYVFAWLGVALLLAHTYTVKFAVKEPAESLPTDPRVREFMENLRVVEEATKKAQADYRAKVQEGGPRVVDAEFVDARPRTERRIVGRRLTVRVVDRSR